MAKAAAKQQKVAEAGPPARLQLYYREKVVPDLMTKFGYKSVMQVPRIEKITLNMGVGESTGDKKILDNAVADMTKIAGQKPVVTKARKSIATFKLRAGFPIGCMVTLRGARMYEFLDRLVNIPASATSAAFLGARSTAVATTVWASRSRSSFRKSITTRSTRSGA